MRRSERRDDEKKALDDLNRDDRYSIDLQRRGVSKQFYDSNRMVTCPECGKTFNLFYSRAKLCSGCPKSVTGCELACCVNCHTEFPLNSVMSKGASRMTTSYMDSVIKRYHGTFGEDPRR
jgi:hypothetical protein